MSNRYKPTPWIVRKDKPNASVRLFCFPYAGGGAGIFHPWLSQFPSSIDVCAIEPPGRLARLRDPAPERLSDFCEAVDRALAGYLDLPFAVLGYSLGALMAFEWTRHLRRHRGLQPTQLLVAAAGAPHLAPLRRPISHLAPRDFLQGLEQRYGAVDAALRTDPETLEIFLRIMRRDLRILEQYQYLAEDPLSMPITAIGGTEDLGVPKERLTAWEAHSTHPLRVELIQGGHFFLRTRSAELATYVQNQLQPS